MSKSTRYITIQLTPEVFETLSLVSSEDGVHPAVAATKLVENGLISLASDPMMTRSELRIFAEHRQIQKTVMIRSMLESICREVMRDPDEESWTRFEKLCSDHGVTPEEITRGMENTKGGLFAGSVPDPMLDQIKTWLVQYAGSRSELFAKEVIDAGVAAGYKEYQIKSARKSLGWGSIKRGKPFIWTVSHNIAKSILTGHDTD